MKYCVKCGAEMHDDAVICTKCGCAIEHSENKINKTKNVSGLQNAAFVFMIISTVILGFYLLPLAWTIPMTISYNGKIKNKQHVSTSFKVCTLLFVSLIAGIIMLCDKDNN